MMLYLNIFVVSLFVTSSLGWMNPTRSFRSENIKPPIFKVRSSTSLTMYGKVDQGKYERSSFSRQAFLSVVATGTVLPCFLGDVANAIISGQPDGAVVDYRFYTPQKDALKDQIIVITGATTGLGLESAKRLAYGGATVVMTSRTKGKGEKAVAVVQDYLKSKGIQNENVYTVQLDLDDLENVRGLPERLINVIGSNTKIDVLMNNAGVMAVPKRELTKDGYERTFQSNHLGHFLVTNKLMPFLKDNARVINVSSSAHMFASSKGLELDNLNGEKNYGPWSSYGQSKLANILFTEELQKRANRAGKSITAIALHPGAVQTDLARNMMGSEKWEQMQSPEYKKSFTDQLLNSVLQNFVLTVEEGASTQVYLASVATPSLKSGAYYEKCKASPLAPFATDESKAKALWEMSEQMTGEEFKM